MIQGDGKRSKPETLGESYGGHREKDLQYNLGDGREECEKCGGRGVLEEVDPYYPVPVTVRCECVYKKDLVRNLNRAWPGQKLARAESLESSPLLGKEKTSMYITATSKTLKKHLKHVGKNNPSTWFFRVANDTELAGAWLSPLSFKGEEIFDTEAAQVSGRFFHLEDCTVPPDLLILVLGVKSTRNKALPEVVLEAIQYRDFNGKPTWVVDQPNHRLNDNHLAYSDALMDMLDGWGYVSLDAAPKTQRRGIYRLSPQNPAPSSPSVEPPKTASRTRKTSKEPRGHSMMERISLGPRGDKK